MAETWPTELDDCWLLGGFQRQNQPVAIRSEVEAGAAKVRQRYTRPIRIINAAIKVAREDLQIFDNFFDVTLSGGTKRFSYNDPVSDSLKEYRFINPPVATILTDKYYILNMQLEQMN